MKQLIQNYKTGELGIYEVPTPICDDFGCLVETKASLVSAGTEKLMVDLAKKSLLGKAKARPDLVKQVIDKMKKEGIRNTLEKVFAKLDTPIPLGYSIAGRVIEVGSKIDRFNIDDRVACGGAGYANHAEINYIPKNLMVKIPANVDDIDASFVTVGAIALQGVRKTNPLLGEKIAVIGLGLIGQLTVQILKANGCKVIGSDIDKSKLNLAKELGCDEVCLPNEIIQKADEFSSGYGVDAVLITASTPSNTIISDAADISRMRGRIVVVGLVGMDVPRDKYYKKELDLKLSMSYGPGRYDSEYEEKGIDYPYDLVRFTEQRNFESFLGLIEDGYVTPKKLITHTFEFNEALKAYELLEGKVKERYLGIVLTYKSKVKKDKIIKRNEKSVKSTDINVALIGAGNFTKSVLLPNMLKIEGFNLLALATATGVSANSIGKKYNFKYISTDADEIIKNDETNTVVITTRHNDHASRVISALKSKKHIFVEKPLCINEEELEEISKVYDGDVVLQVGFNRRFSPFINKIKSIVGNDSISINYRINAGVIPRESWVQDREIGGGRIIGEVCHFIDVCSYLTSSLVKEVYATCIRTNSQVIPNEDNVSIVLKYENGSIATITYFAYGNSAMPKEYMEVFSNGVSIVNSDYKEMFIYKDGRKQKEKLLNQDKGFVEEFRAFKEAIKNGKNAISFESIYNTTKTTFKILESLKNNKAVMVE